MGTIDGIMTRLNEKIAIIKSVVKLFDDAAVPLDPLIIEKFNHLSDHLVYDHIRICSTYYFLHEDDPMYSSKKTAAHTQFIISLTKNNYISVFDHTFEYIKGIGKKYPKVYNNHLFNRSLYKYNHTQFNVTLREKQEYHCRFCGDEVVLIVREAALECVTCHARFDAKGLMLSDDRSSITEKSTKSNQYQSRKHAKAWLEAIQGLDSKKIPEEIITYVKNCAKRDRIIDMEMITCSLIRSYLSKYNKCSASKYNQHISKIRKLITGIEPPQLTEHEMDVCCDLFSEVISVYNTIKKKANCPYYPYFIYKILEHMFRDDVHKQRREKFFSYIHLQLDDTLNEHDKTWAQICARIPEIEYKSTERYIN